MQLRDLLQEPNNNCMGERRHCARDYTPNTKRAGVDQNNCGNEERSSHGEASFLERNYHAKHASETIGRVLVLAADRKLQLPGV